MNENDKHIDELAKMLYEKSTLVDAHLYFSIRGRTQKMQEFYERINYTLNDSFGWGSILTYYLRSIDMNPAIGLLFTGPEGTGKHHALKFVIQTLSTDFNEDNGYRFIFISGEDFEFDDPRIIPDVLERIIICCKEDTEDKSESNKNICLVVEDLDKCSNADLLAKCVVEMLYRNEYSDEPDGFYCIVIAEEEKSVPGKLRKCLMNFRMSNPDSSKRRDYITNTIGNKPESFFDQLVEVTEGYNYDELIAFTAQVRIMSNLQNNTELSESQLRQLTAYGENEDEEETMDLQKQFYLQLLDRIDLIIDKFPEVFSGEAVKTRKSYNNSPGGQQTAQDKEVTKDEIYENAEKMTGRELTSDLLGDEFLTECGL